MSASVICCAVRLPSVTTCFGACQVGLSRIEEDVFGRDKTVPCNESCCVRGKVTADSGSPASWIRIPAVLEPRIRWPPFSNGETNDSGSVGETVGKPTFRSRAAALYSVVNASSLAIAKHERPAAAELAAATSGASSFARFVRRFVHARGLEFFWLELAGCNDARVSALETFCLQGRDIAAKNFTRLNTLVSSKRSCAAACEDNSG